MLDDRSMKMLAVFASVVGGCAAIGLMMIALAMMTAITAGVNNHILIIFGVFGVGAIVSYLVLRFSIKRLEQDAAKRLSLDE